jgi:hypothetical protein
MHGNRVSSLIEQNAVVSNTQAQQALELARKRFHPALTRFHLSMQRFQNVESNGLRDGADLRRHAGQETDFLHAVSVFVAEDLIHCEAAFGGELLERHSGFGILPEVFARGGDSAAVFLAERLAGGFHHYFEQLQHGRYLIGTELFNQFMDVPSGFRCINGHGLLPGNHSFPAQPRLKS